MASEDDARRIALALPATEEKQSYGEPGFRVADRLFARLRHDPDALVIWRPDLAEKAALMEREPEKFFQTPHYEGHPAVLVRLAAVDPDELAEILTDSWLLRAPKRLARDFDAPGFVASRRQRRRATS